MRTTRCPKCKSFHRTDKDHDYCRDCERAGYHTPKATETKPKMYGPALAAWSAAYNDTNMRPF